MMNFELPDLCDEYPDLVRVVTPMFRNFGARKSFSGEIVTIKCHEDNSLVAEHVEDNGTGRVMVVDGGGSLRCALLGDNLAEKAAANKWSGIIIYGCIRDVDIINNIELGVQALAANPMRSVKRQVGLYQEPVSFGGVSFIPGEYVYADNNGIAVAQAPLAMPD